MPALPHQVRLFLAREIVADAGNAALRAIRKRVLGLKTIFKRLNEIVYCNRLNLRNCTVYRSRTVYSSLICILTIESNYYVRLYYNIIYKYKLARMEVSVRYGLPPRARWEAQPPAVQRP